MTALTCDSALDLAERFESLKSKLPEGWVWNPTLVKSPFLKKKGDIVELYLRGYTRTEKFFGIFCSAYEHRCKMLLAYKADEQYAAKKEMSKAWLREDLSRTGEIWEDLSFRITLTHSVKLRAAPPPIQKVEKPKLAATPAPVITKEVHQAHHHTTESKTVDSDKPVWGKSWRDSTKPINSTIAVQLKGVKVQPPAETNTLAEEVVRAVVTAEAAPASTKRKGLVLMGD